MAKEKTFYVCASCGYETARWLGCCPDCGEWNTFEERKNLPISVSKTAEKAVENAVALEECAYMSYRCSTLNGGSAAPAPQALQDKHYFRKHGAGAYYGQK